MSQNFGTRIFGPGEGFVHEVSASQNFGTRICGPGKRLFSRGFRVPKFWDTDLRGPDTLAFTIYSVPKLWETEFEPCPDHRYNDVRVPLATRLAIAFECAIWQLLTNPKISTQGSTRDHVITCMFRYPPGRSGQLSCRGRGEKSQGRINLT